MVRNKDGKMKLEIIDGLPFVGVILTNRNKSLFLKKCLVDTGSAGTVIPVETALELGLCPEWSDKLFRYRRSARM